jgi:hypothetical protein
MYHISLLLYPLNLFLEQGEKRKGKKRNYLKNKIPLAYVSRRRFIPACGTTIGENTSRLCAPGLARKSAQTLPSRRV